jgi:hypothetical protein
MNAHRLRSILSRRNLVPLAVFVLLSLITFFGFSAGTAQTPEKEEREVVDKIPKHLPIKVKVKKPEKLKDTKNEDWLGELELEVTNTGTKPIYFLDIYVHMPDVFAPNGLNFAYVFSYGRGELIAMDEPVRPGDVPIKPGETVVLKVHKDDAEGWKRGRAKGEMTNPKKLEFFFNVLNFGDGTGFVGSDGSPLPERKEHGANATCPGVDNARGVTSVTGPLPLAG